MPITLLFGCIAESLAAFLRQELGFEAVHTENLPLKIAAVDMGLATYGENGVLLSKEYGSYFALCGVLTSAVLHPEAGPIEDQCTHCGACRRACPTRALYKPYALDPMLCVNAVARRSTPIEEPLRGKIGSWFRGCDVCQEVCPKNGPWWRALPMPAAATIPFLTVPTSTWTAWRGCPDCCHSSTPGSHFSCAATRPLFLATSAAGTPRC